MRAVVKRIVDGDTLILDVYIGVAALLPSERELGMGFWVDTTAAEPLGCFAALGR